MVKPARPDLFVPPKLAPGDRVAIVSPSWAGPGVFPAVHDLGLQRLREIYSLEPFDLPTTRKVGATAQERAADVMSAFTDPEIKAVMASIGGDDQITILKHLDPAVLRANPKPYFGYSDNTNLLIYIWNLGIVGYHGGSTMVHLGRPGAMHPVTEQSLRTALFESGEVLLAPSPDFTDEHGDWADVASLDREPNMRPGTPWRWGGHAVSVTGPSWGGCLEIVDWHLRAGRWLLAPEAYAGCVLMLETSEEMPSSTFVHRALVGMGERGLLEQFSAVVWGRPKAWDSINRQTPEERDAFTEEQFNTVDRVLDTYHPGVPRVFGLDIGHTDPQVIIPYGGQITVDRIREQVHVTY